MKSISLALALLLVAAAAFAAAGDRSVELRSEDGASLGTGFVRAGALWVPSNILASMGVHLNGGPNGKGFVINVTDLDGVFGDPDIAKLSGGALPLYFPSAVENDVHYFNVTGVDAVTGVAAVESGGVVTLRRVRKSAAQNTPEPLSTNGKLTLTWAHITKDNPDLGAEQRTVGLDVLSPTWFNLTDGMGNMASRASAAYVDAAHRRGYKVWGLVSNGFSKTNTTAFFRNAKATDLFIARILAYAKLYDLDGINIDFENVDPNDRAAFVNFMAALSQYVRPRGLAFSVDVHIPSNTNSSRSHDRSNLAKYVDYVMLMAYDEHWRTCQTAGSVASLPWVEKAVQGVLAEGVPAQKLVLGVPFYMRRWEETPTGGKPKIKALTLTMAESDALMQSKGLSPMWIGNVAQNFYSYTANGKTYKVWVEDERSLEKKLALIGKYGLAGMAGWRRGHEKPAVWNTIAAVLGK